jgi:hypothetical protein
MPLQTDAEHELAALQLHDLRERRATANKRAILFWLVVLLLLGLFMKGIIG